MRYEFNLETHIAFISFQKTFVKVDRNNRWSIFYKRNYSAHIVHNTNPLNAELNPICHLLVLLGAHPILHISRIGVNHIFL